MTGVHSAPDPTLLSPKTFAPIVLPDIFNTDFLAVTEPYALGAAIAVGDNGSGASGVKGNSDGFIFRGRWSGFIGCFLPQYLGPRLVTLGGGYVESGGDGKGICFRSSTFCEIS